MEMLFDERDLDEWRTKELEQELFEVINNIETLERYKKELEQEIKTRKR